MANGFYTAPTSDEITQRYFSQPVEPQKPEQPAQPKPGFFGQFQENIASDIEQHGLTPGVLTAPLLKTAAQQVMTPDSPQKGFWRKVGEDAVALGAGIPIALSHPIDTLKSMVTTKENPIGGATAESIKNIVQPEFYKEHPLLGAFNTGTWVATVFSFGLSKVVGGAIERGAAEVASEAAVDIGVQSAKTAAETAFTKSILRTATKQAMKTGDFAVVTDVAKNALLKAGFEEGAATKLAESLSTKISANLADKATQIGIYSRLAHPIDALGEGAGKVFSPVAKAVFGEPNKSAVAALYGVDAVMKDPKGFAQIEDWAGKIATERSWENTVANRQSIMNEWASTVGEWSLLTAQEKVAYHQNYIAASDLAMKISNMTGDLVVPTKFLSPAHVNAIVETINNAGKNETPMAILDALEQIYGNDIGIHRASIEKVITANPTKEALVGSIEALGKRHTLNYTRLPEINKMVQQLQEQTGYQLIEAPKGKVISFASGEGVPRQAATLQVGITSAQPANPAVAAIMEQGNALYASGKLVEGLAKLQEATAVAKGDLAQTLSDGVTKITKLETDTYGLYFGVPEPSFWLKLRTTSLSETLGSLAAFAKKNLQDSFITAKRVGIQAADGSFGFTVKFGKQLSAEDVLAIEKLANDGGLGLTLNQATGEAVAYNIKQFDGLEAAQFVEAAGRVRQALKDAGYKITYALDKYEMGVYTKDTYEQLIAKSTAGERVAAAERGAAGSATELGGASQRGVPGAESPGVGGYTGSLSAAQERLIGAKTRLGKLFTKFGLSPEPSVEGTLEGLYADEFSQSVIKQLGEKYPNGIKLSVINEHTGEVAGVRTVPLDRLYGFLDRNKTAIEGIKPSLVKTRFTVSDISAGDLVKLGMEKEAAGAITKIARQTLADLPFSQTGLMEGIVNLARAKIPAFNTFVNLKFETHFNLNPFYAARFWFKTQILKGMKLNEPAISFGTVLDEKLQSVLPKIPYLKDIIAPKVTLPQIKLMADEILYGMNKNVVDFASNPELITMEKAIGIGRSIQSRNVFLRAVGYNIPYDATAFAKAVAEKYGMTLEDALSSTVENGVKRYYNPTIFNDIRNSVQTVFHYEPGILTSPLMKTINTIWFPARFETKVLIQTSRWLGSLSPISRLEVMSNMIHFANWAQTPEGVAYRKKYQTIWEARLDYLLPYREIGDTVGSVLQGQLFNGKTGMIGGLPFGWLVNAMQDLSIIPGEESTNPITGKSTPKRTPKKLASTASTVTVVEDLLTQIFPSMPFYTLLGGSVPPFRSYLNDVVEGIIAPGKKEKRKLDQQFRSVKQGYTRY